MRIVFITSGIAYAGEIIKYLRQKRPADRIHLIVLPQARSFSRALKQTRQFYNVFGFRVFIFQMLYFLLARLNFSGMKRKTTKLDKSQTPIQKLKDINSPPSLEIIKIFNPDVIVSFASPQIFGSELLKLPRSGCLNIHPSLLPKYRGPLPVFWALLNNEKQTGISIHFMNDKVDGGDIFLQEMISIDYNESYLSLNQKILRKIPDLLVKALNAIETGNLITIPNDEKDGTYFPFPSKGDGNRFKKLGKRFI